MINMVMKKSKFKLRRKTIKILVFILNTILVCLKNLCRKKLVYQNWSNDFPPAV